VGDDLACTSAQTPAHGGAGALGYCGWGTPSAGQDEERTCRARDGPDHGEGDFAARRDGGLVQAQASSARRTVSELVGQNDGAGAARIRDPGRDIVKSLERGFGGHPGLRRAQVGDDSHRSRTRPRDSRARPLGASC